MGMTRTAERNGTIPMLLPDNIADQQSRLFCSARASEAGFMLDDADAGMRLSGEGTGEFSELKRKGPPEWPRVLKVL